MALRTCIYHSCFIVRFFVKNEDMFNITHDIHYATVYGSKYAITNEVNRKYESVMQPLKLELTMCVSCQKN